MKPNEGRLQTAEHIFAKIVEEKYPTAKVIIARFDKEDEGRVEFSCDVDLRNINQKELENQTNDVIAKNLKVTKTIFKREEVENEFNLSKISKTVKEIRIVEIVGFDKRPCRDPHVDNTSQIGKFHIKSVKKSGAGRYRFILSIF